MSRKRLGISKELRRIDAEYNRVIEARREYEASLAPPRSPNPPTPPRRVSPVTVVSEGHRAGGEWVPLKHSDYIQSRRWHDRKIRYYQGHDKKCFACGTEDNIHLHHKTYARMGAELDEDLVPLCQACHTEVHQKHGSDRTKTLAEVTDQVVKKGWLKQKKAKRPAKKAVKANQTRTQKAVTKKIKAVTPHEDNPVEHISPDVLKISKSGKVTVHRSGEKKAERVDPDWVKRAQGQKRRKR